MEGILALEQKLGKSLIRDNTDEDARVEEIQGAVGGLDFNVENKNHNNLRSEMSESTRNSPVIDERNEIEDEIYEPSEPNHKNKNKNKKMKRAQRMVQKQSRNQNRHHSH